MSESQTVVDKYSLTDEKLFMTVKEAIELSHGLAEMVKDSGFTADKVIGVANGALLPATIVADALGKPLEVVRIRRKGSKIKKRMARIAFIRDTVSALYNNKFTRPVLTVVMDYFSDLDDTEKGADPVDISAKRILVVDDAIETGQTLQKVIDLHNAPGVEIQIAVISWSKNYKHKRAEITPEFVVAKRIHHYPWSQNSPHLTKYQQWLESRGLKEWD